ncbi:hypothetical protein V6N13_008070 [Hibiscus sabdariffa]
MPQLKNPMPRHHLVLRDQPPSPSPQPFLCPAPQEQFSKSAANPLQLIKGNPRKTPISLTGVHHPSITPPPSAKPLPHLSPSASDPKGRNNPREPLYAFDPKIERTQRRLRTGIRVLMGDHIGQNLVEGQIPPAPVIRQQPPIPAGGLLIPPAQQNNQQLARTVRDYLAEDLDGLNPAVTLPEFEAEHFELKPVMFNMLNTLGQFGGSPAENARQHLKSFLEICNSFKIHGVSNDVLKLKLFRYSLRDKAKD